MRYLNEREEAVGSLLGISVHENSLQVIMDSAEFSVDFPSIHFVEQARKKLSPYIGKKVAIFREADSTKILHIRLAAPHSEARMEY
jgi:hypothetical protein